MRYFKNYCWCSDSNWGGMYDCQIIVSIDQILDGGTFFDKSTHNPEWYKLTNNGEMNDGEGLKPEVIKWLDENVKDIDDKKQPKGWCIGSKKYIKTDSVTMSVFFQRRSDAMKFAKVWGTNGTFSSYLDRFRDVRKKYCPVKKRLILDIN